MCDAGLYISLDASHFGLIQDHVLLAPSAPLIPDQPDLGSIQLSDPTSLFGLVFSHKHL